MISSLPSSVPVTPVIRRARAITSPTAVISGLSKHSRTAVHVTCERTYTKGWDLVHGRKLITITILLIISLCHPHLTAYEMKTQSPIT
jgi:hypothetical protein